MAWVREQGQVHHCGTARYEWADDPDAYHAVTDYCPGCEMLENARKADKLSPGMYVRLEPRGDE